MFASGKMNYNMDQDEAPPTKRLKLELDENNNIEVVSQNIYLQPPADTRKRKIAVRQPVEKRIVDMSTGVLLDIFDYLPLKG